MVSFCLSSAPQVFGETITRSGSALALPTRRSMNGLFSVSRGGSSLAESSSLVKVPVERVSR